MTDRRLARVGVDIGGSKTQIRAESADGAVLTDHIVASTGWDATDPGDAAAWISQVITATIGDLPGFHDRWPLAIGAQGIESDHAAQRLAAALSHGGWWASVCNDAELLLPASGWTDGIAIIAGTGAIGVARTANGRSLRASGWGWVLADDGGGAALVRQAARAVLRRADHGQARDPLGVALLADFAVSDEAELAATMSWRNGVEDWACHAPVIFAQENYSADAAKVISAGAQSLADLAVILVSRGADPTRIVIAGSVACKAPGYGDLICGLISAALPGARPRLLSVDPVIGAVELARRMAAGT
ncbi:MAG: hypothetical protein LBV30_02795 [Propionibacteriaceae bacterium]|jgi:N-acetylglucosamine kinase-like BadF-type ATPase|nr:hypothetical protein [Propionibacteriaceae bacterium]